MDPAATASILLSARVEGDEALATCIMAFAPHSVDMSRQFASNEDVFNHSLRCDMCFSFSIRTGTMMPLEKVWAASEEHGAMDHPWVDNWSTVKN